MVDHAKEREIALERFRAAFSSKRAHKHIPGDGTNKAHRHNCRRLSAEWMGARFNRVSSTQSYCGNIDLYLTGSLFTD
jgi:hypothetical protein